MHRLTAAEPQEGDGLRPASQAQRLRRLWELETVPSPVSAWPVETSQSLRAPGKQDLIKQKGFLHKEFARPARISRDGAPLSVQSWGLL